MGENAERQMTSGAWRVMSGMKREIKERTLAKSVTFHAPTVALAFIVSNLR